QKKKWQHRERITHPLCARNRKPCQLQNSESKKKAGCKGPTLSQQHDASGDDCHQNWKGGLDQQEPEIESPRNSRQQTRGKVQIERAVEIVTTVRDAIMVKPMQDSAKVTRKENNRVHQNEGEE